MPGIIANDYFLPVAIACGSLSALGCCVTIFVFAFIVRPLTTANRMLLFLTLTDLLQAIQFATAWVNFRGTMCSVQLVYGVVTATASFFWTVAIAAYVYWVTRGANSVRSARRVELIAHCCAWGIPLGMLAIQLAFARRTITEPETHPWCFIAPGFLAWRLIAFYIPLFISWVGTLVLYTLARRELGKATHSTKHYARFVAVPLGFIALRLPGVVYRFAELSSYDPQRHSSLSWLLMLTSIGDSSQGSFNCLVFILLNPQVRRKVAAWLAGESRTQPAPASAAVNPDDASRPLLLRSPARTLSSNVLVTGSAASHALASPRASSATDTPPSPGGW